MLTKTTFANAIIDHMKSYYTTTWGFSVDSFDAFAPANIWFITVTSTAGFSKPETAMAHYRKMHFDFLKQLLGDHLGRKVHLQPFGYAFIDFASTKKGANKVRVRPHVHAVLMIHPETVERLADIGPWVKLFDKAKRFDPVKHGPMLNMATYAMKGAVGRHGFHTDEDCAYEVFPRINRRSKANSLKRFRRARREKV